MASQRISGPLLQAFHSYARWYMKRNFHAVRVAKRGVVIPNAAPLIVCLNHPSWWDPLLAMVLAMQAFPGKNHYAPMEAEALRRYRFLEKLGFFGVETGTSRGAVRFLQIAEEILRSPDAILWITAQGAFTDPRDRPVNLRGGIGHLVRRVSPVSVAPLAIEYPFWEERYPEALAMWGDPILISDGEVLPGSEWTHHFASALRQTQDRLAVESIRRNLDAFEILVDGTAGVGGVYDLWRSLTSRLRGQPFRAAHGAEDL